jgi:outer membrane protein assembly factor BamB
MKGLFPALLGVSVLLASVSIAGGENWPQFRGPTGQGLSSEKGVPTSWSATNNVAWKTSIPGESWSSPIIWNDRVFLTTATGDGTSGRLVALERTTGTVLWDKEVLKQSTAGRKEGRNTFATPTPATDGKLVYAVFFDGSFVAVDYQGAVVWTNRSHPFYSQHGLGTSPLLWNDLLIMARDGSSDGEDKLLGWQKPWDNSFILALDKNTGKERWKTGRGGSRIAHVVPVVYKDESGTALLLSGAGDVVQAHNPATGERLWSALNKGEGVVPSPAAGDGLVFTACGFSGRDSIKAFRLTGKGELSETNLAWELRKAMPKIPSLLYVKPHLFTVTENGQATCIKGETGDVLWQERLPGNYAASPVYADDHVYFLSETGETTVIEAAPQFKVVSKNPLNEKCQASMAISGKTLFIRTEKSLYCIR